MTKEQYNKLQRGDWVRTEDGTGTIQDYALFEKGRWRRSSRRKGNGAWLSFWEYGDRTIRIAQSELDGYYHMDDMKEQIPAPLF